MARSQNRRAVFLDLNGTLVLPIQASNPGQYRLIPHAAAAVATLCRAGFICPVVTVQSRVGKGMFSESEFRVWFQGFAEALAVDGARLNGPYVCPHRYAEPCACKKPSGLLYREAARDLEIDLASSFVVGDTRHDMVAASLLGCRGVAVRTGWGVGHMGAAFCDHVADDVMAAAKWIVDVAGAAQQPLQPTSGAAASS